MPKGNRGGRRSTTAQNQQAQASSNSAGGGGGGAILAGQRNYTPMSDADAQNLRDTQDLAYNGSVTAAIKMYITGKPGTAAANIDGQGHSMSQTMNYLLEQGVDLSTATAAQINSRFGLNISDKWFASMQYTNAYMEAGAHAIGKDTTLTRLAHDTVLKTSLGIPDYTKLSDAQLQQRLVGTTFTNNAYLSTSYDMSKNPFGSSSGIGGGREIVYNIKAGANTKVLMGARSQAEIIINKGTNFRITGVHSTGAIATPRGGSSKRQIQIDIEVV